MPQYTDIGKSTKDLLLGNAKSGAFVFEPKLTIASSSINGVAFALNAIKKADTVDGVVKASYVTANHGADAILDATGRVYVNGALTNVLSDYAPGLKLTASAMLPDPASARVGLEYAANKEFNMKASTSLTSAPVVDLSAACDYNGILIGGETAYDTASSAITKVNLAAGYHTLDYQMSLHLLDRCSIARFAYAHSVTSYTAVGSEVTKNLNSGATTFAMCYSRTLASGALAKVKLDNTGTVSTLYEAKLLSGERVSGSLQFQATDLQRPVKYGFALDLS